MLAALHDAGWDPRSAELVVGTSIGSVVAGLLRAGLSSHDIYARVAYTGLSPEGSKLLAEARWPTFPAPAEVAAKRWGNPSSPSLLASLLRRPRRVRAGLVLAALANPGAVDPGPIAESFGTVLGHRWPEPDTWVCAVDLDSGERRVFGAPGTDAVRPGRAIAASCAVPAYFTPVEIGGRRYIDGGIASPANTDLLAALGGDWPDVVVVSLPMGAHGDAGRRGWDLPGRRRNHSRAAAGLAPLARAGIPVLTVEPTARELELMHYDAFDRTYLPEVAARARITLSARIAAAADSGRGPTAEAFAALVSGGTGPTSRPDPEPFVEVEAGSA